MHHRDDDVQPREMLFWDCSMLLLGLVIRQVWGQLFEQKHSLIIFYVVSSVVCFSLCAPALLLFILCKRAVLKNER